MATHFVCQATEPIPHKFPTSRNPEKGHGAVSQYEVLNIAAKKHTEFPPAGWDTSQSSEDSLPLCQPPAPLWKVPANLIGPDPELCVTPEKGSSNRKYVNIPGVSRPPVPTQNKHNTVEPDPQLCITPEKSFTYEQKSNLKQDGDLISKHKKNHRVRFDVEETSCKNSEEAIKHSSQSVPNKTYQPFTYSAQENLDQNEDEFTFPDNKQIYAFKSIGDEKTKKSFSFGMKDDGKDSGIEICDKASYFDEETDYVPVLPEVLADCGPEISHDSSKSKSNVKSDKKVKQAKVNKISEIDCVIPKVPVGASSKRKVKVMRENAKGQVMKDYEFPFEGDGESLLEYEHVFARPEYNSTLRIRSEIEQIKQSAVDMSKALEKKLNIADTKEQINEKACSRVNADVQFSGLVSLEVPIEGLCTSAERKTEEKWKSVKPSQPKYKVSKSKEGKDPREPDLLEFFTPNLQRESVELSVPCPTTPSETLATANHMAAFDLYRHNRVWDSSSNFRTGK